MGISLINNVSNKNIANNLNFAHALMFKSMEKLSSGWKINSAADDPAGLVISERMRSQIASLNQEIESANMAINKYKTADSALMQMRNQLTEIRSLAVAAANSGINDQAMQEAYQKEADNLARSYNEIIDSASFGTQELLDGSAGSVASVPQLPEFDLSTPEKASQAIEAIDEEMERLDGIMADVGATQKNSLESRLSNLRVEVQNLTAAESQIRDTDYAAEYGKLLRDKLIVQSAVSLLSHGNLNSRTVLSLLSGV
jgi:flagellin